MEYRSTGMIRPVDRMGRVVIPKEMRAYLGITDDKDSFEIYLQGKTILLRKFQPACIFCGKIDDSIEYNNVLVCKNCVDKLREIKENNPGV